MLPAGERWHYSNLAYALLGELVTRVANTPFPAFVDERLIGPCGLRRTTWHSVDPAALGYYVEPYARTLRPEPSLEGDGVEAVGSLWSTPSDLCRWAVHLASIEAMHQVQIMDDPEDWTLGHGLGLQLVRSGERVFFGHGGAMPGFLAMLLGRRREGVGAALATNASTPSAAVEEITLELAEKALELFPAEQEPWRPEGVPPPEVEELLGTWWTEGTPFVFWWEDGRLRARPAESDKPRAVSVFEPAGRDRFRVSEGRERGELLRVVRETDGYGREAVLGDLPGHPDADDLRLDLSVLPPCRRRPQPPRSRRAAPSHASCSTGPGRASGRPGSPRLPSRRSRPGGTPATEG